MNDRMPPAPALSEGEKGEAPKVYRSLVAVDTYTYGKSVQYRYKLPIIIWHNVPR
jgi:hypothetical protein